MIILNWLNNSFDKFYKLKTPCVHSIFSPKNEIIIYWMTIDHFWEWLSIIMLFIEKCLQKIQIFRFIFHENWRIRFLKCQILFISLILEFECENLLFDLFKIINRCDIIYLTLSKIQNGHRTVKDVLYLIILLFLSLLFLFSEITLK